MKVSKLMTTSAVTVPPAATVRDAAQLMDHAGVGILIVVDHGRITGVVTDRDLTLRALARDLPGDAPVAQVMSPDPVVVAADDDLDLACATFRRHTFRRLPVVHHGTPIGVITVDDVLLRSQQILTDVLCPSAAEFLEPPHLEFDQCRQSI